MILTEQMAVYKAFGLTISSDVLFPELQGQQCQDVDQADISIQIADLSGLWTKIEGEEKTLVVRDSIVMFKLPDIGIFCIQEGDMIQFTPVHGSDPNQVRLYLLGTCIGVILLQRRILPLHGSAIAINGKAYAVVGESGAGKSTLATVLLNRGYQLLSDDVIPVMFTEEEMPLAMPSYPRQKLWQESISQLGMTSGDYQPLFERETKFSIPVASRFHPDPLPLAGIFELVKNQEDQLGLGRIQGIERLSVLYRHTYRKTAIAPLGLKEWHFRTSVHLTNRIDLFRMIRPITGFTAHELADSIISEIHTNSIIN
ncbi:aldolase [Paenibacillus macerans]|uniref:aldolase n=1 Tax=Paenibacillus macerans TaxID=44252 RepID=UPI003D318E44